MAGMVVSNDAFRLSLGMMLMVSFFGIESIRGCLNGFGSVEKIGPVNKKLSSSCPPKNPDGSL